jgi:exodeoxyribonuclease VII small subunit
MTKSGKSLKELLAEFEEVVAWFDGDDIDIETATKQFEKGSKLAEQIEDQLTNAKNQIEVVKQKFDL